MIISGETLYIKSFAFFCNFLALYKDYYLQEFSSRDY